MDGGSTRSSSFSVVLAGGGGKTFWGMGVLESIRDLLPPVEHWAGVSAGAAMSLVKVTDKVEAGLRFFLELTRNNPRNFYPARLLQGRPAFPHEQMLRDTLRFILAEGGFSQVRHGAPVHILLSYIAPGHPSLRTGLAAFNAFNRRNRIGRVHGPSQPPPGMGVQVVRSSEAKDQNELIDWVIASSTAPLIARMQREDGRRYLDGALIDNVPVRALPEVARRGRILVLLSAPEKVARRVLRTHEGGQILYLCPAELPPANLWDFTSPAAIQATFDMGRRDGEVLRRRVIDLVEV